MIAHSRNAYRVNSTIMVFVPSSVRWNQTYERKKKQNKTTARIMFCIFPPSAASRYKCFFPVSVVAVAVVVVGAENDNHFSISVEV